MNSRIRVVAEHAAKKILGIFSERLEAYRTNSVSPVTEEPKENMLNGQANNTKIFATGRTKHWH
jgi:hypothetical protein